MRFFPTRPYDAVGLSLLKAVGQAMNLRHMRYSALLPIALLIALTAPVTAQPSRPQIAQRLTEPAKIELENVPLDEAAGKITDQTGVRVEIASETLALAPRGRETVIRRVAIDGLPLGEGLAQIFGPLGMYPAASDGFVEIVPRAALRCLGRSATWDELDLLAAISSWQFGSDPNAMEALKKRTELRVGDANAWGKLEASLRRLSAASGDEMLTEACTQHGWSWCLNGERIVVTGAVDDLRLRLGEPIKCRISSHSLIDVLQELSQKADVPIRAEPDALMSLPLYMRHNFSLNVANAPVSDALDQISECTGLRWSVEKDGVIFRRPKPDEAPKPQESSNRSFAEDPYVGKIIVTLDNGMTMEWLIRRSELPPDLRQKRATDLQKAFDDLRRQIIESGGE